MSTTRRITAILTADVVYQPVDGRGAAGAQDASVRGG